MWLPATGKAKVVAINTLAYADRVIGRPGISTMRDLKGKKVGVPEGTSGDMVLNLALKKAGMTAADIQKVPMDPATVVSAFSAGQIDLPYLLPDEYFDMYDPALVELPPSIAETFEGKPPVQRNYSAHWTFEDIYRIPGIVRVPGASPQVRDEFVTLTDCTATILDLAGCDTAPAVDSRSLLPLVRGERPEWPAELLAEFHGHHFPYPQRMIRDDRHKLIVNPESVNELYDLHADPYELSNRYPIPSWPTSAAA